MPASAASQAITIGAMDVRQSNIAIVTPFFMAPKIKKAIETTMNMVAPLGAVLRIAILFSTKKAAPTKISSFNDFATNPSKSSLNPKL